MNDEIELSAFEGSTHQVDLSNLTTGGTRHQSRAGYWFDESEPIWKLDKNNDVYISKIFEYLPVEATHGFISTLAHYAVTMSAAHTRNICESFFVMLRDTKPKNIDTVALLNWRAELEESSRILNRHRVPFIFMNAPLCALPRLLWPHAKKSISDWKNVYSGECEKCSVKPLCSGLFAWHERGWKPTKIVAIEEEAM